MPLHRVPVRLPAPRRPVRTALTAVTLLLGVALSPLATAPVSAATGSGPHADAGADQSVDEGSQVTLDGTASSTPRGGVVTFQWRLVSQPQNGLGALTSTTGGAGAGQAARSAGS